MRDAVRENEKAGGGRRTPTQKKVSTPSQEDDKMMDDVISPLLLHRDQLARNLVSVSCPRVCKG